VKILIIDDDPMCRRLLKRLLSRLPEIELHEAEDGEAGWTLLGDEIPGLILCDLSMPRMDGVTFIRKVRQHAAFGDIPVIVTSATKDRDTVLELKDLRILDYLLKPFDLVQTYARLESHLLPRIAEHRASREARAEAARAAQAAMAEAAMVHAPAGAAAPRAEDKVEPSAAS
jgi:two-component system capsular synthesis sensor histidine kinase RcsC